MDPASTSSAKPGDSTKAGDTTRVDPAHAETGTAATTRARELAALYPRWNDFLALRRELDPQGRLLTPYLRGLLGLGGGT